MPKDISWIDGLLTTGSGGGSLLTLFHADLTSTPAPTGGRGTVHLDGFSSIGDGGHGTFHWDASYAGPATKLHVYPSGHGPSTPGAWIREVGPDNVILAAWFGAKGDAQYTGGGAPTGTDDTAALQEMLDFNCNQGHLAQPTANQKQYVCKLNSNANKYNNTSVAPRTCYRITQPLVMSDFFVNDGANTTSAFWGEPGAMSGLVAKDATHPAIFCGNAGRNLPFIVQDPSGSGEACMQVGYDTLSNQTVAAGSDGQVLPTTVGPTFTLNVDPVVGTGGWPAAGGFYIVDIGYMVTYTGKTSSTFTGCKLLRQLVTGQSTTIHTGYQVQQFDAPRFNLSETSLGDLSGPNPWTAFTIEFFINPGDSKAWLNSKHPGSAVANVMSCTGSFDDVDYHDSMFLNWENANNPVGALHFHFTTSATSYDISTDLTSLDHSWVANTLNHVAITWDGSHIRMFLNGAQADSSMTAATSGTLDQKWYEMLGFMIGGRPPYPYSGGVALWDLSALMLLGRIRISNIARYTAPFTAPLPSAVVEDANSRFFLEMSSSVPTRDTLQCYTKVKSSYNLRVIGNHTVWLQNHLGGTAYQGPNEIKSMFYEGFGEWIHSSASLNSTFGEDSYVFKSEGAIIVDNFSYNSGIGKNFTCNEIGVIGAGHGLFQCIEILFQAGSQFSYIHDGFSSANGGANWGVCCVFADVKIGTCFPNSYAQGVFLFTQGCSNVFMTGGVMLDDQTTGFPWAACAIVSGGGPIHLKWAGGYLGIGHTHKPIFRIGGKNNTIEINTAIFGEFSDAYVFSFKGFNAGQSDYPVVMRGMLNQGAAPLIDPSFPGPVIVLEQEQAGGITLTPTADADYNVSGVSNDAPADAFWREYLLVAGAWTGGHNFVWPANPKKIYEGKNTTGFAAGLKRVGSSSPVSVANGARFKVRDNGTDLVSLL